MSFRISCWISDLTIKAALKDKGRGIWGKIMIKLMKSQNPSMW